MERRRQEDNSDKKWKGRGATKPFSAPYKKPVQGRFDMVAQTLHGLEDVLAAELSRIGANEVRTGKRAVYFTADKDLLYKANLRLRTALRLLKPIKRFTAANEDALYAGARSILWSEYFALEKTFAVKASVGGSVHTHSQYAALKVKDAIADHFRDVSGERPNVDAKRPDIVVHLHIYNDKVNLSLDSSGKPLHMRGYRQREAEAPLNECLAAGMLLLSGYDGRTAFVDGMCGSGTIAIEAALIANRIAPGLLRNEFAFMHWSDFDEALYGVIHEATVNRIEEGPHPILALDRDEDSLQAAREAAKAAKLEDAIEFRHADFLLSEPPPAPGMLVLNPPYGERLQPSDINKLYENIGAKLKNDYTGYRAFILSGNEEAMHQIGLRTFATHHLLNGNIECRYSGYQMYSGSKKTGKNTETRQESEDQ